LRGFRLVLARDGELVLLRARDAVLFRDILRRRTHVVLVVDVPQPSTIIESTSFASPIRKPSRDPGRTCGAALMFSWPPAMTISASPHWTACAASITALSPEPHTLLIVIAGTA
jgi:hypothetical protein